MIIQWNGSGAGRRERLKGLEVCRHLKEDVRGGKARVDVCEQGHEPPALWAALGQPRGPIAEATDDDAFEKALSRTGVPKLYRISDATGSVSFSEVLPESTDGLLGGLARELTPVVQKVAANQRGHQEQQAQEKEMSAGVLGEGAVPEAPGQGTAAPKAANCFLSRGAYFAASDGLTDSRSLRSCST